MRKMPKKARMAVCVFCVLLGVLFFSCGSDSQSDRLSPGIASVEELVPENSWKWSPDVPCASCHAEESRSISLSSCAESDPEASCISCHSNNDELALTHKYLSSNGTSRDYKTHRVADGACLACHNDTAYLFKSVAETTILTDDKGLVVNPHAAYDPEEHPAVSCTNCHDPHLDNKSIGGANPSLLAERSRSYCRNCHHENIYECGTCHL